MVRASLSERHGYRYLLAAACAAGVAVHTSIAQTITFQPLGFLDGFPQTSVAWGISADGSTIVGESISGVSQPGTEGWRRIGASGPLQPMGTLNTNFYASSLFAVSSSGRYAAGQSLQVSGGINVFNVGVRCDMQGAPSPIWKSLGALPGAQNTNSTAFAVNADGTRLAGVAKAPAAGGDVDEAFRYVVASSSPFTGSMSALGFLAGDSTSQASGISADGNTVVGASQNPATGDTRAFIWNAPGPMTALPNPPGMTGITLAQAISSDGSTTVGAYSDASGALRAVRWTNAFGGELLPDLPGLPPGTIANSAARAASANGRVIVGYATSTNPNAGGEACIWTYRGIQSIKSILNNAGISTAGWSLVWANGISGDGRIVVGYGLDPQGRNQAWRATIPSDADYNQDGALNPDDLGDYITCYFEEGKQGEHLCPSAEFNMDQATNPDDLGDYITLYFQEPHS